MSYAPEPATLHGIDGHVVDAGANASYFEATLRDDVLYALMEAARRHVPVEFRRGEKRSHAVVRHCWYNTERRSVLVQFLQDEEMCA